MTIRIYRNIPFRCAICIWNRSTYRKSRKIQENCTMDNQSENYFKTTPDPRPYSCRYHRCYLKDVIFENSASIIAPTLPSNADTEPSTGSLPCQQYKAKQEEKGGCKNNKTFFFVMSPTTKTSTRGGGHQKPHWRPKKSGAKWPSEKKSFTQDIDKEKYLPNNLFVQVGDSKV